MAGATGLSYDASGNLSAASGMTLSYDVWGNLSSVANTPYGTVSFTYDSAGRRVSKTVGSTTTFYLYVGGSLIAEIDANGQISRTYTWGPSGLISDHYIGQSHLYCFDAIGNTRALLNENGTVLSKSGYITASGQAEFGVGSPFCWKGRHGQYGDSETGLVLCGARYYAPSLGRFISRDPSGFSNGANLYCFGMADPIDFYDSNGLDPGSEGGVWGFIHNAAEGERGMLPTQNPGLFGPLDNAHDAFQNWGTAEGTPKIKPGELLKARLGAAFHFGMAAFAYSSMAIGGMRGAETASVPCMSFVAGTPVHVVDTSQKAQVATFSDSSRQHKPGKKHHSGTGQEKTLRLAKGEQEGDPPTTTKPVEQVAVGDVVVSRDEKTHENQYQMVRRLYRRVAPAVLTLTFADVKIGKVLDTITTSPEHPFYVQGKGFVAAGSLGIGNVIVTRAGPTVKVQKVEWHRRREGYPVYNFLVENTHSFFVGKTNGGLWVHNPSGCDFVSRVKEDANILRSARRRPQNVFDSIQDLLSRFAGGNTNPGIGNGTLSDTDIFYLRARDGARVFLRQGENGTEIVGYANKATEPNVIKRLLELYAR